MKVQYPHARAHFTADLSIKQCDRSGCKPITKRVALDATSNCTSAAGESLIAVGGAARDELTLTYGGPGVGGPRVLLVPAERGRDLGRASTSAVWRIGVQLR